jgi:hypothetical protein
MRPHVFLVLLVHPRDFLPFRRRRRCLPRQR